MFSGQKFLHESADAFALYNSISGFTDLKRQSVRCRVCENLRNALCFQNGRPLKCTDIRLLADVLSNHMSDVAMPLLCFMFNLIDLRSIGQYAECQETCGTRCGFHSARPWTTGMHNRQSIEVLLYQNCAHV